MRCWTGFDTRNLRLVHQHPVLLDSAGFVAASVYNGFPWGVDDYLDLCAAAPWRHWFSLDWCVEPAIARDDEAVLDRISGTVRLNVQCRNGADARGIADTFAPVIQGWKPEHYLRCLDRMPFAFDHPIVGVGSMCRRHVEGDHGVIRVIDELDRAFSGTETRFHLFGLKSQAMAALRGHERIVSCDSQAYGVAARKDAHKRGIAKTNHILAAYMENWLRQQQTLLASPGYIRLKPLKPLPALTTPSLTALEERIAAAAEELRDLHEAGEIEWSDMSVQYAYEWAFLEHLAEDPDSVV